jgi:hypothetical protein
MKLRVWWVILLCVLTAVVMAFPLAWDRATQAAAPPVAESDAVNAVETDELSVLQQAANPSLVLSYAAKFVCTKALGPGQYHYGLAAPIVQQTTDILVHNPTAFPVRFYKKAVIAPLENHNAIPQGTKPGGWKEVVLEPDFAFRIDCNDIAQLLPPFPATVPNPFVVPGNTVEGFVVIAIGPQDVAGTNLKRHSLLDVTAEYVRSSEVMKKDINYQPWWWWWWWRLPWQLGYPYERIVTIPPSTGSHNIDCRQLLVNELIQEAQNTQLTPDLSPEQRNLTSAALRNGIPGPEGQGGLDPRNSNTYSQTQQPALVPLIGRCDKLDPTTADIDYVLVSNKGPTDADPSNGGTVMAAQVAYPWIPGRWYDLAWVVPQNVDVDIDQVFREWQIRRWRTAGETNQSTLTGAILYYYPYWCGWGRWWWWWHGSDCVDIGVGEGESLDVEQVTPVRVFMQPWPPPLGQ